ncbi:holin [Bacillaceae bacterium SIJ1]|uniref:holin n=1 Tax=Litoribacterium kuwaitense TaxID=1398745 RepID=UPI0013ECF76F|nr:holin [Litoribacterium kuwaitense]NGP43849.1 holin [Litoribacterium kuwaitense]
MNDILMFATMLVPIVTALVQLMKKTFDIPKNWVPMLAVVLGAIVGAGAFPFAEELALSVRIWAGLLAGLSATGLFELGNSRLGTTKMLKLNKNDRDDDSRK